MKEHVLEARDFLIAKLRAREPASAESGCMTEPACSSRHRPRDRRARAARRRPRASSSGSCSPAPSPGACSATWAPRSSRSRRPGQPDPIRDWGKAKLRGPLAVVAGAVAQQEVRDAQPAAPSAARSSCSSSSKRADVAHRELPARNAREVESRLRAPVGREPAHRPRPDLRIRPDGPVRRSGPGSRRPPRRWAGCATSTAFPTSPRRGCTSRSATRWPACSRRRGSSAALYWRDALGGGKGQVIDVSLLESCFAMLESTVPEYDRLGIVREPGGTHLKGIAPSNIFKSQDGKWIVIAANQDNVFGRLCDAMRQARAEGRRRGSPPTSREARTRTRSRASSPTGPPPDTAAEIDSSAERRRGHLRSRQHDRGHLRGRALLGSRHAARARGSRSSARTSARGSRPSSRRRRAPSAGRRPGRRGATTVRSTAGCSA